MSKKQIVKLLRSQKDLLNQNHNFKHMLKFINMNVININFYFKPSKKWRIA